jgi:hypothetical protein
VSAETRIDSGKNLPLFAADVFHPECDWRFVSLRRVEFAMISEPSDADREALVDGELLWGRQIISRT